MYVSLTRTIKSQSKQNKKRNYLESQLSDSGKDSHKLRLASTEKHMHSVQAHEVRGGFVSLATSKDDSKSHGEVLFFETLEADHLVTCINNNVIILQDERIS